MAKGRKAKFEEHNGLKFNTIFKNRKGRVIKTKGSVGFRVVNTHFEHIAFKFTEAEAVNVLVGK